MIKWTIFKRTSKAEPACHLKMVYLDTTATILTGIWSRMDSHIVMGMVDFLKAQLSRADVVRRHPEELQR